jgi:hypothetical protein
MLTLILTTFAVNASISPYADPGALTVLLPFVFVVGFTTLAFLFGRYLGLVALVPLAPITGYLVPALLSATPDVPLALLSPIDDVPSEPPLLLQWQVVLAQVAIGSFIVVGIVALLVVDGRHGRRAPLGQLLIGVVTIGAVVGILASADVERHIVATDAVGPKTCGFASTFEVCAWSQHARLLPTMEKVGDQMLAAIGTQWTERPVGLVEDGLKAPDGWLRFGTGTGSIGDGGAAASLAASLVARLVCGDSDLRPDLSADVTDREQWLLAATGYLSVEYASERVQRVREQPLGRQRAWWTGVQQGSVPCGTR